MILKPKIKILVFADWYVPGYKAGGPIRSVHNMVRSLSFDFWIITSTHDHNSVTPYPDIEAGKWIHRSDNEHVYYCPPTADYLPILRSLKDEHNFHRFYFNSLFSPKFAIRPLRALRSMGVSPDRIVLAPRGMLKAGALTIKPFKKKIFLTAARWTGLFAGITWHATSVEEKNEITSRFGAKTRVRIAPNIPVSPVQIPAREIKHPGDLKLVALSRISPEKNILGGIQYIKQAATKGHITWDVFGTMQNEEYLSACHAEAKNAPGVSIRFKGEINPDHLAQVLSGYHFFFLPTLGENYGHSIAEALMHGLPVIISDRTPWRNLEIQNCGFDVSLQGNHMAHTLHNCLQMDDSSHEQLSMGALEKGKSLMNDPAVFQANLLLFD